MDLMDENEPDEPALTIWMKITVWFWVMENSY
jgi:hypothetical protein